MTETPPDELVQELGEQLEKLLGGLLFTPVDLTVTPIGAPEGTTALAMYERGVDTLIDKFSDQLRRQPGQPIETIQMMMNSLAVSGFSVSDIAAMLCICLDRLVREAVGDDDDASC